MTLSTNPRAHQPFLCCGCGREVPARQDHGILDRHRILCRTCLARDDSLVLALAPDRAAAVAWLDEHGLMDPPTETEQE